jgi:glycosyltransferase involved in cell wall biosynthesis
MARYAIQRRHADLSSPAQTRYSLARLNSEKDSPITGLRLRSTRAIGKNMPASSQPQQISHAARGTIVYVGGFELPHFNAAAHRGRANAMILRDLGYRVILIGITRHADRPRLARVPGFDVPGIEAWETYLGSSQRAWARRVVGIGDVKRLVSRTGATSDLRAIICYNYPAIAQWRLLRYAHSLGARGIADVTEWYGAAYNDTLGGVAKNLDVQLRMAWVNKAMDGLITTSPYLTDHYRRHGLPIVELPTLMDEPPGRARPATPDGAPKRLMFAGSGFDPAILARTRDGLKDRIDLVIERLAGAHRKGARFRLDAYGLTLADYRSLRPDHSDLLEELGDAVTFHGTRPSPEVQEALRSADFSIFFRDRFRVTLAGFPGKYSESVAFGTPVITNPMPNILPYHQEGKTGWLISLDQPDEAEHMLSRALAATCSEVSSMKKHCAESGMFHFDRYVSAVDDFMNQVGCG